MSIQKATFGAGCFWQIEEMYRTVPGVISATSGYEGGNLNNPTYQDVCTDESGHAEMVEIEYDPALVNYETLLDIFWNNHNPTTINRQGPDIGTQYRSAIFFHSPEQEKIAKESKAKLDASGKFRKPIVTEITPASTFWKAEEYHQKYLFKRAMTHCHI
jgi:peptide-methionine (S)-S-oxide reductase